MLNADFSHGLPDLPSGVYRHYKGPLYFVFGYGHDANADRLVNVSDIYKEDRIVLDTKVSLPVLGQRAVVVYMALELNRAHTGPRLAIRTAEDFFAVVCPECGKEWECGVQHENLIVEPIPRFEYLSPEWYGQR